MADEEVVEEVAEEVVEVKPKAKKKAEPKVEAFTGIDTAENANAMGDKTESMKTMADVYPGQSFKMKTMADPNRL